MRPIPIRPGVPANYRALLAQMPMAAVTERELAAAWAALAPRREAADGIRHVTVLRPFTLCSGA